MLKKDLLKLINGATDDQDIDDLVKDSDLAKSLKASGLTLDACKEKMKTDKDFKAYIDSENDKYHGKALKTWKENNLEKELEPFIQSKYPDLVTDPLQKKILELEKKNAEIESKSARKDLLSDAIKYASDKKLPLSLIEKCLGEDIDSTKVSIDALSIDWTKGIETITTEKMKSNSYTPGTGTDGNPISIGTAIAATLNETKTSASDPWGKK
ncbi:DUF4355 domain-containing protein [Clostridium gasigenes]|uniref:DUF4355 domain-containing protein n=1 Tax=Clostridium gasigenes TaxID=94869 RepID=UPI001C0B28CF|nr:DUF4355 domain-containing protein [Clostridium gasigenes]MBU3107147.1 DUF4355 domain-containing protein [Clostridium gasigenes]